MSSVSNKDIALSIVQFLKQAVADKQVAEDYAESLDVAIDCIADAFEVNQDDESKVLGGKSLSQLIEAGLASKSSASATATASASTTTAASTEVDAETKAKADTLKVEGNRAMATKDFPTAIAKYTAAIELDGSNVVYLSNRAAAYSSSQQHEKAVVDAEKAIELNPSFSKAYSRLGLAKYALGDPKSAMDAYKRGLDVEGDNKSDAMTKGYETAKSRVEEELEKSISKSEPETPSESSSTGSSTGAGAGGLPDLSSFANMFGGAGGAGGMPPLSELMNNPDIMQAANRMMQDPQALSNLMSNPAVRQMAQNFGLGGGAGGAPDLSNLANMFGGGAGGAGSGSHEE
ncbi:hypothetical protein DFJ63DRAFT_317773 [Scheffersomyces coipomensis]|uniref:uncharacterized protein n=1 Tax=Scheffersomyces coipomensis TaxID=1788519 RepID=UPI00315CD57D